jgi:hypothetical protein
MSPHHKPKTTTPDGIALQILYAIDGNVTSAPLLIEKFKVTKQRISYLLTGLIKAGWLRKAGKDYVLTAKAKKSTAQPEPSIANVAAPVKDSQPDKPPTTQAFSTASVTSKTQLLPSGELS